MKSMKKEEKAIPLQINVQWQDPAHENGRATYSVYVDKKTMERVNNVKKNVFYGIMSRHQVIKYLACQYLYEGEKRYTFTEPSLINNDFKIELANKKSEDLAETKTIMRMILDRLPVLEEGVK